MSAESATHPAGSVSVGDVTEPFDPPGEPWVRVSPRLAIVRRLGLVLGWLPLTAVAVVLLGLVHVWVGLVAAVVGLVLLGWAWYVVGTTVRSWGYAERADDLLVTRGVLRRQLVVVPYGRMQFVDITSGPVEQLFGIATVHLHTASPKTSARIPGLPKGEAARLRDRLTALGEAQAAGL